MLSQTKLIYFAMCSFCSLLYSSTLFNWPSSGRAPRESAAHSLIPDGLVGCHCDSPCLARLWGPKRVGFLPVGLLSTGSSIARTLFYLIFNVFIALPPEEPEGETACWGH